MVRLVPLQNSRSGELAASAGRRFEAGGLDDRILWALDASADLVAGGVRLVVAPAGTFRGRRALLVAWSWVEAWGIEVGDLVGRRFWVDVSATRTLGDPAAGLRPMPRGLVGPRPLLLAHSPASAPWGARALAGASGDRLASTLGTTLAGLLETFDTANLLERPDEPRHVARRRLEEVVSGRLVVVVGRETAREVAGGELRDLRAFGAQLVGVVAHPSGRNVAGDSSAESRRTRGVAVEALLAARFPVRGLAPVLPGLRAGSWAAWQAAADLGLVAHSPRPGHAWRFGPDDVARRLWTGRAASIERDDRGQMLTILAGEASTATLEASLEAAVCAAESRAAAGGWRETSARGGVE